MMQKIYDNAGFILSFLVGVLILQTFTTRKFVNQALLLVLFSQVILNPDIIKAFKFEPVDQVPKKTELGKPDISAGIRA
jgi:phosphoglycerol transferase MdoB-like AlkP superfamily enzyme